MSPDFLMNGTLEDKAKGSISDQELLSQFKKIEGFPQDKKQVVIELIDAFILKTNLQKQLSH